MDKLEPFECFIVFDGTEFTVIVDNYHKHWLKLNKLAQKLVPIIKSNVFDEAVKSHSRKNDRLRHMDRLTVCETGLALSRNEANDADTDNKTIINKSVIHFNGQDFEPKKPKEKKLPLMLKPKQQAKEVQYLLVETIAKEMVDSTVDWSRVSQQMVDFGHKEFTEAKCVTVMSEINDKYVKILKDYKEVGTDKIQWKLFDKLNQMNLSPFFTKDKYTRICDLRIVISNHCTRLKEVQKNAQHINNDSINGINGQFSGLNIAKKDSPAKRKTESPVKGAKDSPAESVAESPAKHKTKTFINKELVSKKDSTAKSPKSSASKTSSAYSLKTINIDNKPESKTKLLPKCYVEFVDDKSLDLTCDKIDGIAKPFEFKRYLFQRFRLKTGLILTTATHSVQIFDEESQTYVGVNRKLLMKNRNKDLRIRVECVTNLSYETHRTSIVPIPDDIEIVGDVIDSPPIVVNDENVNAVKKEKSYSGESSSSTVASPSQSGADSAKKTPKKSDTSPQTINQVLSHAKEIFVMVEIEKTGIRFPVRKPPKRWIPLRHVILSMIKNRYNWDITGKTHAFKLYDEKSRKFVDIGKESYQVDMNAKLLRFKICGNDAFKTIEKQDKDLLATIARFTEYSDDIEFKWSAVSDAMLAIGHKDLDEVVCKLRFERLVNQYIVVLETFADDYNANAFWPLFSTIHKMDLQVLCEPDLWQQIVDIIEGPQQIDYKPIDQNKLKEFRDYCINENNQKIFIYNDQPINIKQLCKALNDCNTIEEQVTTFRKELVLSEEKINNRILLKDLLESILKEADIDCSVQFFGSTANSMGIHDSDIDLFIEVKNLNNNLSVIDYKTALNWLTLIRNILRECLYFNIAEPIRSKRCPIIKLNFKNLSSRYPLKSANYLKLKKQGINCDINLSNPLGVQNSKLIRLYCEYEPRFHTIALILKLWMKANDFIDGQSGFTSYAFTMLVIFFCQTLESPLLPTLEQLRTQSNKELTIEGWDCSFCDDISLYPKSENNDSVMDLLKKFFKFLTNFDFTTQVILPKSGSSMHKKQYHELKTNNSQSKGPKYLDFKFTALCCIEDPFKLDHNLTANLSFPVFDKFLEYAKNIAIKSENIFGSDKSNNDWGISKIITQFDPCDPHYLPIGNRYVCYAALSDCFGDDSENCNQFLSLSTPGEEPEEQDKKENECTSSSVIKALTYHVINDMKTFLSMYDIQPEVELQTQLELDQWTRVATFTFTLNELWLKIIDPIVRQTIKAQKKNKDKYNPQLKEELRITEEVKKQMSAKELAKASVRCVFSVMCYTRVTFPYLELKVVEVKPFVKAVDTFIKTIFTTI